MNYRIRFTTATGLTVDWHKGGKPHLLPEELVDTWMKSFKPEIFQVTTNGVLVAVGRTEEPSQKIVKIEKIAAES
jgi:hypothetical protein